MINANISNNSFIVNFGPQHPAAHGVLRLILELRGEVIVRSDVHIGLLHRATEFLVESKQYVKGLPYFDRLDYVSMATQEHAFCLSVEYGCGQRHQTLIVNLQRILFDELTRVLNHMLAIACHALDVGSMSPIFWGFEEREKIMEFYERASGGRMHAALHRPFFNINEVFNLNFLNDILVFVSSCFASINEMHSILTYNKIWKQRLLNIGTYSLESKISFGLGGVMSRCFGLSSDLRISLKNSYSGYNFINFKSFLGTNGDCFDRYLIRMFEMVESLNIVNQCCNILVNQTFNKSFANINKLNSYIFFNNKHTKELNKKNKYMEDLIFHFLEWHNGFSIKNSFVSAFIESPKGEFGVSLMNSNNNTPARCKIRSPSFFNLQFFPKVIEGAFLADLSTLIGTIDIVFGEIDR